MLIPNIPKPMNLIPILKQPQRNTMHRRIPPSFIKEPSSAVQMLEIRRVRLAPPERQTANLKVTPEMTRAVAMRGGGVRGTVRAVGDPAEGVVGVEILLSHAGRCEEALCFRPERGDGEGRVVEVYGEAVGLITVGHIAEDVIVDVAEEVDVGLDAPVEIHVGEGGVVREEARIPAAHLVVGYLVGVLNAVFGEDGCGFGEERWVDPRGCGPVGRGDCGEGDLGAGFGADAAFEGFGEGLVVEKSPWVIEFVVEGCFEVADGLDELFELGVADEGEEGGFYAVRVGVIGRIVVAISTMKRTGWFVDNCMGEDVSLRHCHGLHTSGVRSRLGSCVKWPHCFGAYSFASD